MLRVTHLNHQIESRQIPRLLQRVKTGVELPVALEEGHLPVRALAVSLKLMSLPRLP